MKRTTLWRQSLVCLSIRTTRPSPCRRCQRRPPLASCPARWTSSWTTTWWTWSNLETACRSSGPTAACRPRRGDSLRARSGEAFQQNSRVRELLSSFLCFHFVVFFKFHVCAQDHPDCLQHQADEQGSVANLLSRRHCQNQDLLLQQSKFPRLCSRACLGESLSHLGQSPLVLRTCLGSWRARWLPAFTATSTSRRPSFACCWVAWRRFWRTDRASEETSTSFSSVQPDASFGLFL